VVAFGQRPGLRRVLANFSGNISIRPDHNDTCDVRRDAIFTTRLCYYILIIVNLLNLLCAEWLSRSAAADWSSCALFVKRYFSWENVDDQDCSGQFSGRSQKGLDPPSFPKEIIH
jgi:hypothetical protein